MGEAAAGAGRVWNWFCASARSSGGLGYSRESEEKEEEETAGVFEPSLRLPGLIFLLSPA